MSKISIDIASDSDYQKLIAEIYIDGSFAGLVHQELDHLSYEIPPREKAVGLIGSVDADVMIDAISQAKRELTQGRSQGRLWPEAEGRNILTKDALAAAIEKSSLS